MLKLSAIINQKKRIRATTCCTLLLVSVLNGILNSTVVKAMSLLPSSKETSTLTPSYEKLFQGAGPTTNDNQSQNEKLLDSSDSDLSPLNLNDGSASKQEAEINVDSANSGAVLKSTVSTTDYVPTSGDSDVLQAQSIQSIKGGKNHKNNKADKGSLVDQAAAVKVAPLALMQTDGEAQQKAGAVGEAEKAQLADLWEATLTRSPDIQFIVQKLQPTSNPAHLTNMLAKMLSTAAFGGLGAMSMMSPSMGTFAAASMGSSMIQTALGISQSKADKKAKLSQEEEIMMYNMVRTTCDKLVAFYRQYKKCSNSLGRAADDLQDLQNMVNEAKTGQDAAKQLEMEYTLRKQQRDMDAVADDLQHHRQNLVDLSGPEAVAKLDRQIVEEREKLKNIPPDSIGIGEQGNNPVSNFSAQPDKTQTASTICPQS